MNATKLSLLACSAVLAVSCTTTKNYTINSKSGTETQGTAKFVQTGKNVEMDLNVYKLTPGIHAVHIHEKGDCSAPDAKSAGKHYIEISPTGGTSSDNPQKYAGDLPMLTSNNLGVAEGSTKASTLSLYKQNSVIGKALIVHAGPDDINQKSPPRIACGVIQTQ